MLSQNLLRISLLIGDLVCLVLAGHGGGGYGGGGGGAESYGSVSASASAVSSASFSSEGCMTCLCQAATGCDVNKQCVGDVCGAFAISWQYWKDAGQPGGDYASCATNPHCALNCVQNYVNKYAQDCDGNGVVDCADAARLHRLGRAGCSGWLDNEFASRLSSCDASTAPGISSIFTQAKKTPNSAYVSTGSSAGINFNYPGGGGYKPNYQNEIVSPNYASGYVGSSGSNGLGSVGNSGSGYVAGSGSGYVGSSGSNGIYSGLSNTGSPRPNCVSCGSGYVDSSGSNSGSGYVGSSGSNSGSGYVGSSGSNSGSGYVGSSGSNSGSGYVGSSGSGYVGSTGVGRPTYSGSSGGYGGNRGSGYVGSTGTSYSGGLGDSGGGASYGDKYAQSANSGPVYQGSPAYQVSSGSSAQASASASASSSAHGRSSLQGYSGTQSSPGNGFFAGGGSGLNTGSGYGYSGAYAGAASGAVSNYCLSCICNAATGCSLSAGCNQAGCGPLRISKAYWIDAGSPGGDYEGCTNNLECSMNCAKNYLTKYAKDCDGDGVVQCGDFARIHRLGAYGCHGELDWTFQSQIQTCPA